MDALVGQTLHGKYHIGELIGRGGMGSVYRAQHVGTGRPVAVKTILPRLVTDANSIERFRREARAAGGLRHPNIVDVTDFGVATVGGQEVAYLVMEYLEGSTLRAVLEKADALRLEIAVEIVEQIALALDAAHSQGIVHRDLKPDNIWLVPDPRGGYVVRILDFGIAKLRERESSAASDVAPGPASPVVGLRTADTESDRTSGQDPTVLPAPDDAATVPGFQAKRISAGGEPVDARPEGRGAGEGLARTWDSARLQATVGPAEPSAPEDITEFPTARESAHLTELGTTLGTPAYMSPEQCRGEHVDARSDIYSLGIVAWQALAGRHPFDVSFPELLRKQLTEMPPRVDEIDPAVPRGVGEAISVAMAKSPEDRYPSAGAMAGSIRVAGEGPTVILRRSMVLYLERFDLFIRASLRSATPVLAILAMELAGIVIAAIFLGALSGDQSAPVRRILLGTGPLLIVLANFVLWMPVTVTHHLVFASLVECIRSRPLGGIDLDGIFSDLKSRVGLSPSASQLRLMLRLVPYYVRMELQGPAGQGDLAVQIALHEARRPEEVFARCQALSRATRRSYDWVRAFIFASILIPPIVEVSLVFTAGLLFRLRPIDAFRLAACVTALLIPINAILTNPGLSPSLAVLYFRARQALGESVGLSAVMPSRL